LNPDPDGLAQMMKAQGVLAYSLHRNADDPNAVLLQLQFADRPALNSFGCVQNGLNDKAIPGHS
jgi:hypothetical protein